jgi:hypothetical protein
MPQNALVRLIYEAANDPLLWEAFLTKFAEAVHAETAGLLTQDKAGHWARIPATVGMDPAARQSYEGYFVSRKPQTQTATVSRYLEGLAAACLEAARNPRLLGTLVGILRLAARTTAELARAP